MKAWVTPWECYPNMSYLLALHSMAVVLIVMHSYFIHVHCWNVCRCEESPQFSECGSQVRRHQQAFTSCKWNQWISLPVDNHWFTCFFIVLWVLPMLQGWQTFKKPVPETCTMQLKIVSCCLRTLRGEGHMRLAVCRLAFRLLITNKLELSWVGGLGHRWVCYSCRLQGAKSIQSGNGRPLLALCHLVSLLISMPLLHCKPLLVNISL